MVKYADPDESYVRVLSGLRGDIARHIICGLDVLWLAKRNSWEPALRPVIRMLRSITHRYDSVWHVTGYPWSERDDLLPIDLMYSRYYEGAPTGQLAGRRSRIFIYGASGFSRAPETPLGIPEVPIRFSDKVLEQGLACDALAVYFAPIRSDRSMLEELGLCEDDVLKQPERMSDETWLDRVLCSFSGAFFTSADSRVGILCCKPEIAGALDEAMRVVMETIQADLDFSAIKHRVRWKEDEFGFVLTD